MIKTLTMEAIYQYPSPQPESSTKRQDWPGQPPNTPAKKSQSMRWEQEPKCLMASMMTLM